MIRCRVCGSPEPEEAMRPIAGRWGRIAFECIDSQACAVRLRDSVKSQEEPSEEEMARIKRQIWIERGQGC